LRDEGSEATICSPSRPPLVNGREAIRRGGIQTAESGDEKARHGRASILSGVAPFLPTLLSLDFAPGDDRRIGPPRRWTGTAGMRYTARRSPPSPDLDGAPMARQFIYHMQGLNKTYPGGKKVLDNIHLSFYPDAKIGVLGVNGSGKSTLLKIMAGLDTEFTGEGFVAEGAKVGYLPQEPQLDPDLDVRGNVMLGVAAKKDLLDRYNELAMNYSDETADEMAKLQDEIDANNLWDLDAQVEQAMDALGCPPDDWSVEKLSGGERRRVALCKLLLEKPELLLLDEPTNHLDAETVNWLEGHLRDYPGAILIVTHDRYFLDNVTGWILELDRGRGIPYEGNYTSWLSQKQKRLAQEKSEDIARQKQLERESEWMAASPKARQKKSKDRIARYDELVAKQGEKAPTVAQIVIPVAERLGQNVIEFEGLNKAFGDKLLIENLSFKLPPGGIVGVIGPNGAGKTTLFRMITGQEQPDGGAIKVGESVQLGYVDQSRDALDDKKTVWEEISGGNEVIYLGKREINSRAYCGAFNFKGADQQKKVGMLSGGERNRVHLAKMLKKGANVLLLDEPTNDLDVETLRALEEALEEFAGCAVIISHDRFFLDRIATHMLAFEGDSHVEWFEGNFQDYEEDKKRRLGTDSLIPHRLKYKKFSR
jgi:ATP-binding cassette ChvD family protein